MRMRVSFAILALVCVLSFNSAKADVIAYISAGPAAPSNLDVTLPGGTTTGSFDIYLRATELVAGASLNLLATGNSIDLVSATLPAYTPRWASAQVGAVNPDGSSILGLDAFAIPGFGSNGINPASAGSDAGYNASIDAFHYATVNYNVVQAGETTFKFVVGDIEFGVEGSIFLGSGDAAVASTGAGSAGATSANIDGRIVVQGGQVGVAPVVANIGPATVGEDAIADILGEVINLEPIDTAPGTAPVAWALTGAPTYTFGFGALPSAPGLGAATYSINPTTGAFQFNTLGSTRGTYVFNGTASNATGSDPFSLTVEVRVVPEPATLSLIGLALVGFVGFARRRS